MKVFVATMLVCLGIHLPTLAAMGALEEVFFKKAENSIIDLLRIENPTLDSRNVRIEYRNSGGVSFAICCLTSKLLVAFDTKEDVKLGSFQVTVGNTNYAEYQKGLLKTTIEMKNKSTVQPAFQCEYIAEKVALDLFNKNVKIKDQNKSTERAYYSSHYTYDVLSDDKKLGSVTINSADCELNSVSFDN